MKFTSTLLGLAAVTLFQLTLSAAPSTPTKSAVPPSQTSPSVFGALGSTKWNTRSVADSPQQPFFMLDNPQTSFEVEPISYLAGTAKVPTSVNAYVGPASNGYTILMNGDSSSNLKLSDLFVHVVNTSQKGDIGSYYEGGSSQSIPLSPTILWRTPEQTASGPAFSLSFEVRNLRTYPAGNYNARLFFTVVPQ